MSNLKCYEEAIVKYHKDLRIKAVPILSLDFHYQFVEELKHSFTDLDNLKEMALKNKWQRSVDWNIDSPIKEEVIIVTDAKLTIVFASQNMIKMNGYSAKEVLGNNPKMFQGELTDRIISSEINAAIQSQQAFEKTIINYKKNGDVYACLIKAYPVFNIKGQLSHYIAFEKAA
ncbi:PAS domain-containing protein [Flavobacterium degerlachei]|jgi:PAS domain S-box-containing protein|uniref:PAS domain S-box-containing protein n=1 Tax=Flavobacterium degerlachei TaxID=229203 RepID=A0A1H2RIV2_9FLAO|nr:PAS domain-containing protein [Flavobacterium degerlachei]SDW19396.1 PAS domain S-box-containing protein [Flavobacterium degerlachei]